MSPIHSATLVVAVVAAVRSTWSPCGWSMLSTLTPLAERRRGHRFGATACWYVLGAAAGGLSLGAGSAVLALAYDSTDSTRGTTLMLGSVGALVATVSDSRIGPSLPGHRRQVNEQWIEAYRPAVYGLGFGWQIGAGVVTYIRTSGVYLLVLLTALAGSPVDAVVVGSVFGTVRGVAIFAGAGLGTPAKLARFHTRFAAADERSRRVVVAIYAVTAAALALRLNPAGWPGAATLALVVAAVIAAVVAGESFVVTRSGHIDAVSLRADLDAFIDPAL